MEASKYKRRAIQIRRQTTKINLGNPQPVPQVVSTRPLNVPRTEPARLTHLSPISSDAVHRMRIRNDVIRNEVNAVQTHQPPKPVQPNRSPAYKVKSIAQLATQSALDSLNAEPAAAPPRPRMPAIDMELPGEETPLHKVDSILRYGKVANVRRWAFRGAAAGLALFLVVSSVLFSLGFFKANKVFSGASTTPASLKSHVDPSLLKGEGDGRINVLLLGRGGGTHDAPDLTDTIILDSIDPVNHTSKLISIPRDLWINISDKGSMKINAAWQTGEFRYLGKQSPGSTDPKAIQAGFDQIDQTVEQVLGVTIHYNAILDFTAFKQAVDTVGGVDVNVPTDLVDPTMAWENGNDPVLAKAGPQTFDGKHALIYVRSRETTSDFARSERQRTVLLALKTKVDTLGTLSNPVKLAGLFNSFSNNVKTDLSLKDATRLYSIVKQINDTKTASVGLADPPNDYVTTGNINGQSVVIPKAGLFKYDDIQAYVRTQLQDPYILEEHAKVMVVNGTTTAGFASAKSDELKTYGYNVIGAANAPTTGWTQTTLVNLHSGQNKYTAHYLEQRFNVKATSTLPDSSIQTNGADFVVILGSDEATTTQTTAR